MDWTYNGITDFQVPKNAVGFIYILKYDLKTTAYLGKKDLYSKKTITALKTGKLREGAERIIRHIIKDEDGKIITSRKDRLAARKRGLKATKEKYDVLYVESNWRAYTSSSDDVKEHTLVSKEILQWAFSKKELTYLENKWLYSEGVLEKKEYLNSNIEGRFFKSEFN